MNHLTIRKQQLPDNIEELKKFIIIGEGVLRAHRSQLHTIKKLGVAQDYYNAKLYDGQNVAEIVLEAQGKLGRVLEETVQKDGIKIKGGSSQKTALPSLPPTITKKESYIAQSIAKNPEVVRDVIERAKDNREIPTTREVLEKIQIKIRQAKKEKIINFYKQRADEYKDNGSVEVMQGDFKEVSKQFPDNHFDHIITDPPYPGEYLSLWTDLGKTANRLLKPSGFLIAYSGQFYLDKTMKNLSEYLEYYWLVVLLHTSRIDVIQRNVRNFCRTILVFQKRPIQKQIKYITDVIQPTPKEKDLHPWQQSEGEMDELLERFTHPGDLILDPFAGSGTTLISCLKNKRRCIGIELEKENVEIIKGRIANTVSENFQAILSSN